MKRERNEEQQDLQEREYWFPYHYIASFQPNFGHCFLDTWSMCYVSTIEFILEELALVEPGSIIDVGCGDGRLSREVARHFPQLPVLGVDVSSKAIALARAMNTDVENLRFSETDITKSRPEHPFEVAVLMEVLEHIPPSDIAAFVAGSGGCWCRAGSCW